MTTEQLEVAALAAVGVAVVALLVALVAAVRLARVRRDFAVLWAGGRTDVASIAAAQERRLSALAARLDGTQAQLDAVRADVGQSLRNVAVVRYDAFGDMGGRLSFSCAVVDDAGDGLVISSIHARGESRTYAKGIVGGRSEVTLTPEEQQALAAATRRSAAPSSTSPSRPSSTPALKDPT